MWNLTHHFNYIRKYREPRAKNGQGEQEKEQTERPALATPGECDTRCLREGGIGMREKQDDGTAERNQKQTVTNFNKVDTAAQWGKAQSS